MKKRALALFLALAIMLAAVSVSLASPTRNAPTDRISASGESRRFDDYGYAEDADQEFIKETSFQSSENNPAITTEDGISVFNPDYSKDTDTRTQSHYQNFSQNFTLTGNGATDIVAVALAQEGKTGSELGYTEEWCADFVGDCAILANQSAAVPLWGGVSGLKDRIINAGGTYSTSSPQVGDICFIDWNGNGGYGHVEIVYAVSGSQVSTIGGNSGNGANLYTRIVKKHNPLNASYITCIVRPNYHNSSSSYINQCTQYNCYATVTAKANAKLWTLPCSNTTDPSSQNLINCSSSGESLTATRMYKNTKNNYWYRVTKNGTTYYLYAGNVTNVSLLWDVTINNPNAPSSITQGSSYSIGGVISTNYLKLSYVSSYVYSGSNTSGSALTGTYANIDASSYSLYNSSLDLGTSYGILPVGTYTTVFAAKAKNNYSTDGTSMSTTTGTYSTLYTKQFTVTAPAPTVYDLTLSTTYIYKYLNDSTPTTVICSYTASKFIISVRYHIADTSVCACSWGEWSGNSCPLNIRSVGVGVTTVTVTLENYETGEVLDTQYITVRVEGDPWLTASTYSISTTEGDTSTYEVIMQHAGYLPNGCGIWWYVYDTSICSAYWGEWFGDRQIPLYITPTGIAGSTTVRVDLKDGTDESIVATIYIDVYVAPNISLDEALNYDGSLPFSTGSDYPFFVQTVGGFPSGVSSNGGVANSESWISTRLYLSAYDTISFWYICSSEANFDFLKFYANNEEVFSTSGDSSGWVRYTYDIPTSGFYDFKWSYIKDGSIDSGDDRVVIDDVSVSYENWTRPSVGSVLNNGDLYFQNGSDYGFAGDLWYGEYVATSMNFGANNSTATLTCDVYMNPGDVLYFEYLISSESNYDWFTFYINGQVADRLSGNTNSWADWTFTNATDAGYYYTLTWEYSKDVSVSSGLDCVKLRNFNLIRAELPTPTPTNIPTPTPTDIPTPTPTTPPTIVLGDVNGDGVINANDALMVLRYSLGIINQLNNPSAADVNGDGFINAIDALTILRASLGIFPL